MRNPNIYWASELDSKEVVDAACERIKRFRERMERTGRLGRIQRSLQAYEGYGPLGDKDSSRVNRGGETGELAELTGNQYGGLVQQAMVLITSSKPAFKVIATNNDYNSLAQAQLAEGLLDAYERKLTISDKEYEATQNSVLTGEGFVCLSWDATAGKNELIADPEGPGERAIKEGDVEIESKTLFDVAYDSDVRNYDRMPWVCVKRQATKFDLAAKYPDVADKLIALSVPQLWAQNSTMLDWGQGGLWGENPDTIDYWELRHLPTPACPNGRLVMFVTSDVVLYDSMKTNPDTGEVVDDGYPYDDLAFYRITPEVLAGRSQGHTAFFDLLGLQQGVDLVALINMSAINSGGLMRVWLPPQHNASSVQISEGLTVIESAVKPEALDCLVIAPEVNQFAEMCVSWMRQRVAINDVVMGETSKGMPAQAMALLRAQAVEFHSRLQANYERLLENVRTGVLKMLKRYAKGKRVAVLSGKSKTWARKEFTAEDLSDVDRISVEPLNPVARTFAGKMALADKLFEMGFVKRPEEYLAFITTGRLDPILEGPNTQMMQLAKEKELLQQGIGPQVIDPMTGQPIADGQEHILPLKTDPHWLFIPEAVSVLAMPGARDNPAVVQAVTNYVDQHMKLWEENTQIALAMGGPPAPPLMNPNMMPPGGAPGMPPMGPPPPGGEAPQSEAAGPGGGPGPQQGPMANVPPGGPDVRLPKPPPNPLTGEPGISPPINTQPV